jgi:HSP20 family protein
MFVLPLARTSSHRAVMPGFSRTLDRLFEEPRARQLGAGPVEAPSRTPAMDVTESDTHYTVVLDMPGISREQLKVSVDGRRVSAESVQATLAEPNVAEGAAAVPQEPMAGSRVLYRERSAVCYARTVSLPTEVDQATSQAKLENGVLTLTLAKRRAAGATQLNVT